MKTTKRTINNALLQKTETYTDRTITNNNINHRYNTF